VVKGADSADISVSDEKSLGHLGENLTYCFVTSVWRGPVRERAVTKELLSSLVETSRSIGQGVWNLIFDC